MDSHGQAFPKPTSEGWQKMEAWASSATQAERRARDSKVPGGRLRRAEADRCQSACAVAAPFGTRYTNAFSSANVDLGSEPPERGPKGGDLCPHRPAIMRTKRRRPMLRTVAQHVGLQAEASRLAETDSEAGQPGISVPSQLSVASATVRVHVRPELPEPARVPMSAHTLPRPQR